MGTSKVLQKPHIIEIKGSVIRVAHPDLTGYLSTRLAASIAAAGVTATVLDNMAGPAASGGGWVDNDWLLFGHLNNPKTETTDINGAVTRGTSVTVTNYLKFAHEVDCPVTKILERGIKIYGAATDGGSGTLIASVDAITASAPQLADCVMIQWNKPYTEYIMISTDTAYAYYYVTFTDGTTDSSVSDYVLAAGPADNSLNEMALAGLELIGEEIGEKFSNPWIIRTGNNCQDTITHYVRKTRSGVEIPKDWSFELFQDETSIALTENENKYALSGLSSTLKQTVTKKAIQSVKIGSAPLDYVDIDQFDEDMKDTVRTEVKTAITAGDTSIVLDDTYEFTSSGKVYIGADTISYTGNTKSTGTLTGCTNVDNNHSVGDTVWQGVTPAKPTEYTVISGYIYLNAPVDTDYVGYKLKVRGLKVLTRFSDLSDTTDVKFYNLFHYYFAAMGEYLNKNREEGDSWMTKFERALASEARRDVIPILEEFSYKDVSITDGGN